MLHSELDEVLKNISIGGNIKVMAYFFKDGDEAIQDLCPSIKPLTFEVKSKKLLIEIFDKIHSEITMDGFSDTLENQKEVNLSIPFGKLFREFTDIIDTGTHREEDKQWKTVYQWLKQAKKEADIICFFLPCYSERKLQD